MTHTGYGTFVRARSEAEAVALAREALSAERAIAFDPTPIYVEEGLGDEWEVVLKAHDHRPEMTKRIVVGGEPRLFRLCVDCAQWVDPTPIYPQSTVGGGVVPAGATAR